MRLDNKSVVFLIDRKTSTDIHSVAERHLRIWKTIDRSIDSVKSIWVLQMRLIGVRNKSMADRWMADKSEAIPLKQFEYFIASRNTLGPGWPWMWEHRDANSKKKYCFEKHPYFGCDLDGNRTRNIMPVIHGNRRNGQLDPMIEKLWTTIWCYQITISLTV